MRGEEKWRLDRTGTPQGWLGEGRGSHARRELRGLRGSGGARLASPLPSLALGSLQGSSAGSSTLQGPVGPRAIGGRRGEEEERWAGGALPDQRIREVRQVFALAARPQEACWAPRPPLGRVGPSSIGGRQGEKRRGGREGSSGAGGSGEVRPAFPPNPLGPRETCWAPRPGALISRAPSSLVGLRSMGGREEGGRGGEADHLGPGDQGRHCGRFPCPLGPGKPAGLLGLVLCLPGSPLAVWVPGA